MDYFSLVLQPGDDLHGCGGVLVDGDGTWFEPSRVIPLVRDQSDGRVHQRGPYAIRLDGHDPAGVATNFGDRSIPGWATIAGVWLGDRILATSTRPRMWRDQFLEPRPPHGRRDPRSCPELVAAFDSFAPHRTAWTYSSARRWMDPQGRPHFSITLCRVTPGFAAWAAAHPAVIVHVEASLLPADVDPVATALRFDVPAAG